VSSIRSGTRLGHYEVVAPLGSGGMGEVYRARDSRLGREVAIKVLPKHLQQDEDARARFEREAKVISGLNHPHILTIHEVGKARIRGEWRATHYMVTELIDGVTLRELMGRETDGRKLIEYLAQVADALQKAHNAGVVHRDLKPENIMVSSDGYAKVLDFGLAKFVGAFMSGTAREDEESLTERFQTQQGVVIGTLGYMSPEQVQGKPLDNRSDVFSFGCILYEVLSGRRAFEADGVVDTLHHILHAPPSALPPHVTQALRRAVDRCLAKLPSARFESMRAVAAALRDALQDYDGTMRPASKSKTRAVSSRGSTRIKSLAVMPFANTSDDPEMEYLSDGITESIIHLLTRVGTKRLRIMARSTVFAYKGKEITPQQLAAELGVTAIVTGRVQRIGANILISIELVSTRDGSQMWGERFRKPFSDIFDVQDEIATQIADQLRLQLTPSEKQRIAQRPTRTSEAYELYLKGRFHANKRTIDGIERAVQHFEKAIELDPSYALARAGLADCYAILGSRYLAPPAEVYARAEREARRAAELDPQLAQPHATIGLISFLFKWDWPEADRQLRRALLLDNTNATAHHWYSIFLNSMERGEDALREGHIAVELEPLNLLINCNYADLLYFAGRYDDALVHVRRTLELENFFLAHLLIARIYAAQGLHAEALAEVETAIRMEGRYPELVAELGYIRGIMGDRAGARAIHDELRAIAAERFVAPAFLAQVSLAIGDYDAALEEAEAFFRMRGDLAELLAGVRFAPLRQDPRWTEMLERVGFPDRSVLNSPAFAPTATL
jgi:eukaryotic-like serine/threonine-protein kinase